MRVYRRQQDGAVPYEFLDDEGRSGGEVTRLLRHLEARVSERHRPFMGAASRQRAVRRAVRVKTVQHLPRPLSERHVAALFGSLRRWRDRAVLLLMLQGGLRPGEALSLHLEDVQYGRR